MPDTPPHDAPAPITWTIEPGAVGPVALGKPLPAAVTGGAAADLGARYVARYIADAQPIDAFTVEAPALLVVMEGGPFARAPGEPGAPPPVDALRGAAADAARGGLPVRAVLVTGPEPRTAAGVGVGSDLAALQAAYPDLKVGARPPTLGKDMCVATTKALPGVAFVFTSCGKARAGDPVIRVDLWP